MRNLGYKTDREAIIRDRDRGKMQGRYFQLPTGKTILRIMPPYNQSGVWFKKTLSYFFRIDDDVFTPAAPLDRAQDPIRQFSRPLFKSGEEKLIQLAKKLNPTTRFLVNAVVVNDQAEFQKGIQVVSLPIGVKNTLVELDTDEEAGFADITDIENGFNIIIDKTGKGLETRYTVKPYRERSDILKLAEEKGVDTSNWNVNNLDACEETADLDHLVSVLDRVLASDPLALELGVTRETPFGKPKDAPSTEGTATAPESATPPVAVPPVATPPAPAPPVQVENAVDVPEGIEPPPVSE